MSVQAVKKARIEDMEKARNWLEVNLPTYVALVEDNNMKTILIGKLLSKTEARLNDNDPQFTEKVRTLCLRRIEDWKESRIDWKLSDYPRTKRELRVFILYFCDFNNLPFLFCRTKHSTILIPLPVKMNGVLFCH